MEAVCIKFSFIINITPNGNRSKHGKLRPSLLGLVSSNSESQIRAATTAAFDLLSRDSDVQTGVTPALNKLTVLKGIGPASASLLLSVRCPESVPFFSDEAFRWVLTDADFTNNAGGKGWNRNIKYDKREYAEYIRRVRGVMARLGGVKAVDVERAGWVLGKEKVVIRGDPGQEGSKLGAGKAAGKRKAGEVATDAVPKNEAGGGPRRSKRIRK